MRTGRFGVEHAIGRDLRRIAAIAGFFPVAAAPAATVPS
jgi:hypothetical protein